MPEGAGRELSIGQSNAMKAPDEKPAEKRLAQPLSTRNTMDEHRQI